VNDNQNSSTEPSSAPSEPTEYQAAREAARNAAVEALTAAARLEHPQFGQLDFAEFAAGVLASVAANVGGVGRVLAGRPGSWEAAKLGDLLYSTVGYAEEGLARHRTEPVVIPLNVHGVMAEHATGPDYLTPYERELEAVDQRYAAMSEEEYDEEAWVAEEAEKATVDEKWTTRYQAYAQAFTAAVAAEAARIEDLRVPVTVEANTDPDGGSVELPEPGTADEVDPLAWRLWEAARRAVPLPGSDSDGDGDGDTAAGGRDV
jgi:hypothetical protein